MNRKHRRYSTALVGSIAAGLALGACAGTSTADTANTPEPAVASSPAAVTEPPAPASSAPVEPTLPAEMKVGQTFNYISPTEEQVSARVLKHKTVDDVEGVEVKVCNTGTKTFTASRGPWVLLYDGGDSEHNIDISGGGLPAPAYPDSFNPKTLTTGKCARGWVNWTSIAGKRPYGVTYMVEGTPAVWKF